MAVMGPEQHSTVGMAVDGTDLAALISTVVRRVERLEADAEELSLEIAEKTEHLRANSRELRQLVLDMAPVGFQESLVRSLARQRRPVRGIRWRSVVGNLRRLSPREIWRIVKDYRRVASSPLFDREWYLAKNQDVLKAGFDPVLHYLLFGAKEGRLPGPNFDTANYLKANADVQDAGVNPLVHFLRHGMFERRSLGLSGAHRLRSSDSASSAGSSETGKAPRRRRTSAVRVGPHLWQYIGDSIDWIKTHQQLTGVGKASTELLLASFAFTGSKRAIPCVLGGGPLLLTPASLQSYEGLLRRVGMGANGDSRILTLSPETPKCNAPEPGDHVFFPGLVWTPTFKDLFEKLAHENIDFSVLVYDIIPIESPEIVGEEAHRSFSDWLATTVNYASVIYVSGQLLKDKLLRWAAICGLEARAEIVVIGFGLRPIAAALSREELAQDPLTARVNLNAFVLSVGTIDRRKNQTFLCSIWKELGHAMGLVQLPQLVLAGRDDLGIVESTSEIAELVAAGKILILEGLSDAQLAGLYKQCLFTAFPSLSEGYGLPVAESLAYGKLCLSSDLPVIREHARDLVWYFSTGNFGAALALFSHAIQDVRERNAAELRISREFHMPEWTTTYETMVVAAERALLKPVPEVVPGRQRPHYRDIENFDAAGTLDKVHTWCTSENPDVSILIINWNASLWTLECIRQIWAQTDGCTYEIVIADNGSAETDVRKLRNLGSGIRLLELGCNRFFGEANNIAAEEARGRYICLLNNDAFVQPGWLTPLVKALKENDEVGASGPMFLFPDRSIQEAGAFVDAAGYPIRFGRCEKQASGDALTPKYVDYISAAALLVRRHLFMEAKGFDLAYEPAYYEDVDLCFRIQALGRKILYCPDAKVVHIEGQSANDNPEAEARRKALGDLNREKFVSRWGKYLRTRDHEALTSSISPHSAAQRSRKEMPRFNAQRTQTAAVYTPFRLTPGGGESYLLSAAAILAQRYEVALVTPQRYSSLRLQQLAEELSLDLSEVSLMAEEDWLRTAPPDLMLTIGNHIVPSIEGRGKHNIYLCQFPFHIDAAQVQAQKSLLDNYETIVVYSDYVRAHVYASLSAHCLAPKRIAVVRPPVRQIGGDAAAKKNVVLSVGRFFVGGHAKRQDVLIDVFKSMVSRFDQRVELHLAGSSIPDPQHMEYLTQLTASAQGYPIYFHVNQTSEQLQELYRDAAVYWHGTGIGADLLAAPEKAEHFGISLVEAMSTGAVPFSLAAGGPREIITNGETGFLYDTTDELAKMTLSLFAANERERRERMGQAALQRASQYSPENFHRKINDLVDDLVEVRDEPIFRG